MSGLSFETRLLIIFVFGALWILMNDDGEDE